MDCSNDIDLLFALCGTHKYRTFAALLKDDIEGITTGGVPYLGATPSQEKNDD